jgi:hypothetical protein
LIIDPVTRRVTIGIQAKKVSGIDLLLQIVVITLLSSPYTDFIDPSSGGGLLDMIGANIDPDDLSEAYSEVSRKVSATQDEIIKNQIGINVSPEEKLRKIEIVSIGSTQADEINIRLRIEMWLFRG